MDFGTLRSVIVGALARVPAGAPAAETADEIARSIQVAEQLMAGMNQKTTAPAFTVEDTRLAQGLIPPQMPVRDVPPSRPASDAALIATALDEPVAAPRRVQSTQKVRPADFEYFDVDTIRQHLEECAPAIIEVDMGKEAPLTLHRQIKPDEALKLVRLAYHPNGSMDGPVAIFSTTQERIGLDEKLAEIEQAAKNRYFAAKREIKPRAAAVQMFDPSSGRGGVGGDADEAQGGAELAARWRNGRTPEESAYLRGS